MKYGYFGFLKKRLCNKVLIEKVVMICDYEFRTNRKSTL